MTVTPQMLAACEIIAALEGGTSINVRIALKISSAAASNYLTRAASEGLLSIESGRAPRRYQVTQRWHDLAAPDQGIPLEIEYVARPRMDCVLRGTPWQGMSFIGAAA